MRRIKTINQNWYFTKNQIDVTNTDISAMEQVTIPHTWNALDGQDGGSDYYRGRCYYAYELERPETKDEIYLEFNAVSQTAEVFINGKSVAIHEGGFSIFRVNITKELKEGKNLLVVTADNGENDRTYPQFADFTFYGGIYRDVKLITVSKKHFDLEYFSAPGITATPVLKEKTATVTITGYSKAENVQYLFIIKDAEGNIVDTKESEECSVTVTMENPHLWNGVKDPYLYTASIVMMEGEELLDEVTTRFGIRNYFVDPEKGFFLNGTSFPLHGVSRHQCREDKGWAIGVEEHRQDIELIAEMGANSIRLAHYQHSQDFYDLCDEFGMVVWAEIPFISQFISTKAAYENTMSQMKELVCQNFNHPSICFWGISNEISMAGDDDENLNQNLRDLNELCHTLDPHRLTTIANLSMVDMDSPHNFITDIVSYNHYFGWYVGEVEENGPWLDEFHQLHPEIPLGLSEYGAEGNVTLHSEMPKVRDYSEEYHCLYHEGMLKTFAQRPYLWSTYVWNMFEFGSDMRDEGGVAGRNNKGLVNFSRTLKKDAFYLYKAFWTVEPFVYVCGRRYEKRCGETRIKVYGTGIDSVTLMVGENEIAKLNGEHIFSFEKVVLPIGENQVTAIGFLQGMEMCREAIFLEGVTSPWESYHLPEEDSLEGEGVTNWFSDEYGQKKEMEFKEGYFSVKDKLKDIMAHPEGSVLIAEMMNKMMASAAGGKENTPKIGKAMMKMMGNMSMEQLMKMAGKRVPEGALAMVNEMLSKIEK